MTRQVGILLGAVVLSSLCWSVSSAQVATADTDAFHRLIPLPATVELVVDGAKQPAQNSTTLPGFSFTEGPSWINGKLYFSNLCFDNNCTGYGIVEMNPDGTYHYIEQNVMRTNGTMPLGNGNLAACDMFGHRVVEITTQGKIVRVIGEKLADGTRYDGPNDLVIDAKGGIYFTDPQYTPGQQLAQPGKAVYYIKPSGETIRVIETGQLFFPNGVLLSPDGKTLYACSTNDNNRTPTFAQNYVMAYPVNEDGTLGQGRRFAQILLTTQQIRQGGVNTGADGMTIDQEGNLFVTSNLGIQVFDRTGQFLGLVKMQQAPVNCCFGGDDFSTLYITSNARIYKIKTATKGLVYPLGSAAK